MHAVSEMMESPVWADESPTTLLNPLEFFGEDPLTPPTAAELAELEKAVSSLEGY